MSDVFGKVEKKNAELISMVIDLKRKLNDYVKHSEKLQSIELITS